MNTATPPGSSTPPGSTAYSCSTKSIPCYSTGADDPSFAAMLLQRLPNFGPAAYWQFMERFESPQALLDQPPHHLSHWLEEAACLALGDYQRRGTASELGRLVTQDLEWLNKQGIAVLHPQHPAYPSVLKETHRAPFVLYARGNLECLQTPQIAVVGSRSPSPAGRDNAHQFSAYLAGRGFTITSGLALGVDGAAHQGALDGGGKTVAVLGTGIDSVYPVRHRALAQRIVAEGGVLLSEFPLRTIANPSNFPQRNRIISGLSLGVLVVEAAPKSGSLITARYALQQNREVFAIPGSIHNPLSRGCHRLIREGAILVETADDMVEELRGLLAFKAEEVQSDLFGASSTVEEGADIPVEEGADTPVDTNERRILENLGYDPVTIDCLVERMRGYEGFNVGYLTAQLMNMEIKGLVEQTAQGFQRASKLVLNRTVTK